MLMSRFSLPSSTPSVPRSMVPIVILLAAVSTPRLLAVIESDSSKESNVAAASKVPDATVSVPVRTISISPLASVTSAVLSIVTAEAVNDTFTSSRGSLSQSRTLAVSVTDSAASSSNAVASSPLASNSSRLGPSALVCTVMESVTSVPLLSVAVAVTVAAPASPVPSISTLASPPTASALDCRRRPIVVSNRTTSSAGWPFSVTCAVNVATSLPARTLSGSPFSSTMPEMVSVMVPVVSSSSLPPPAPPPETRLPPPPPPPPPHAAKARIVSVVRRNLEIGSTFIGAP